ncbi:MAG: hypothetical protein WAP99_00625 [Caldicoprobacterales bacterium]
MKHSRLILAICILLLSVNMGAIAYTEDEIVTINDPRLEEAIREELGKASGYITKADMASLESLYIYMNPPLQT